MFNAFCIMFVGARDGKPFTIQLQPDASTDSLPKAYTWLVVVDLFVQFLLSCGRRLQRSHEWQHVLFAQQHH